MTETLEKNKFVITDSFGEKTQVEATVELYLVKDPLGGQDKSGLAIQLWAEEEYDGQKMKESYMVLTKNFGEPISVKNAAYIDVNNFPYATQLIDLGLAEDTGLYHQSGYVNYPLWKFDEEFLKSSGIEKYNTYLKDWESLFNNGIEEGEVLDNELDRMSMDEVEELLQVKEVDYKAEVKTSVEREFKQFKADLTEKGAEEVFSNNYKIHVYDNLCEVINSDDYLSYDNYKTLYNDRGSILSLLYDECLDNNDANVDSYYELAEIIDDYCLYIEKERNGQAVYFGKNRSDVALYYFKDNLSLETLSDLKVDADEFAVASRGTDMTEEELIEHNITFLKIGKDVVKKDLEGSNARFVMESAYNRKFPLNAQQINLCCSEDLQAAINSNFDGLRLNTGFEDKLIDLYGYNRLQYVLANTVMNNYDDGRYTPSNKEWARSFGEREQEVGNILNINVHPAVLDGFITRIRRMEKENRLMEDKYLQTTARGDTVEDIKKDDNGRNIAIVKRGLNHIVAFDYNTKEGRWSHGVYEFDSYEGADLYREEIITGKREEPKKWVTVKVPTNALVRQTEKYSIFSMPNGREYDGYTFLVDTNRVKDSTQMTDIQSDSREVCYELVLRNGGEIELYNREKENYVNVPVSDIVIMLSGSRSEEYTETKTKQTEMIKISVPQEAVIKMLDKVTIMDMPNNVRFTGYSYIIPNSLIEEDAESDEGRLAIVIPENFTVNLQKKGGEEKQQITATELKQLCDGTKSEEYSLESNLKETDKEIEWHHVKLPKQARLARHEDNSFFKMPDGEYKGFTYNVTAKCIKEKPEEEAIVLNLHNDYYVTLTKRTEEDEVKKELTAKDFCEAVRGKDKESYRTEFRAPSEEEKLAFQKTESTLRASIPDEMKERPNWVVVRTQWNEKKGRFNKYHIDCNTGGWAEIDNPDTWTDFESALKFAREKGGTTLAYALDGNDKIVCLDFDNCYNGKDYSAVAKKALRTAGKTYSEDSVSGTGLHIFGVTEGMDLKTYSKDGDIEFYQKDHFITVTGDSAGHVRLQSFDTPEMKAFLESKFAKHEQWKGVGQGLSGISTLSDAEIVEKASNAKNGEKFQALYSGEDLMNNHSNSDMSLMSILAYWCEGDKDQMLRIFSTSGLYRPDKSADYYEHTAIKAARELQTNVNKSPFSHKNNPNSNSGGNGKA